MPTWPEGLTFRRRTPSFHEDTVPAGLLAHHTTRRGVWGRIIVERGRLGYAVEAGAAVCLGPGDVGIVEPEVPHRVWPEGPVTFHVEFWSLPEVPR